MRFYSGHIKVFTYLCILSKYENKKYGLSEVKKHLQWLIKAYRTTEKYKVYHSSP